MNYRYLKDLKVSSIGLGCMGLSHAYGAAVDANTAISLLQKSYFEAGVTFFDTARCYEGLQKDGLLSCNEELVGKALHSVRDKVVIASKFGIEHQGVELITDSSEANIRRSLEQSLHNLNTDHVDLYFQHRIDPKVSASEVATVMASLIKEGKITHWGVSEASEDYIREANAICPITAIQNRFSMLARHHSSLFKTLEELDIGFVAFSPIANGALSGCYKQGDKFEKGDYRNDMPQYQQMYKNYYLLTYLKDLADKKGATTAQISLAWMLHKKPYIVPIPGSRKFERVLENSKACEITLSDEEFSKLEEAINTYPKSEVFGGHKIVK